MEIAHQELLLRRKQVEQRCGISRSTIYELMANKQFPKPIPLVGRTVAWKSSQIDAWIADRIKAAEGRAA